MTDRSTIVTPPGDTAWVYDPQHNAIHFVSSPDASLYSYSLDQQAFSSLALGSGSPSSIAISPDGQTLVIGNANALTVGANSYDVITRVDLATQYVDWINTPIAASKLGGVSHIAVDTDGNAIFGVRAPMPDGHAIQSFTIETAAPVAHGDPAFVDMVSPRTQIGGGSYILSSPDHRFLFVEDPGDTSGSFALYDGVSHSVTAVGALSGLGHFSFHTGRGDVTNAGLVVDLTYNDFVVLDQNLHLVKDLAQYQSFGSTAGAVFSDDGSRLYAWAGNAHKVMVFDTGTWTQVATFDAVTGGFDTYGRSPTHNMQVVDHGSMLALDDGQGRVELIDLVARGLAPSGGAVHPPEPSLPPNMGIIQGGAKVWVSGNMEAAHLHDLLPATITEASDTTFVASDASGLNLKLTGSDFTYADNHLTGGAVGTADLADVQAGAAVLQFSATMLATPAAQFEPWLVADDANQAFQTMLAGNDRIGGLGLADVIHGYGGNDLIFGSGGADSLYGGDGDDVILAGIPSFVLAPAGPAGPTFLRGEAGDDYIVGGALFDDIHGNTGNDTESGGDGNDWVVGGKDNDQLFGDAGNDIVYGNLGDDLCVGGTGDDVVRGGQANDLVYGGQGNDWLSGDRGDDTITGGAGADVFHTFSEAGLDRVTDFRIDEGDRVQLDPGTSYTVAQVGADVVIDMGGANRMILEGVTLSNLPSGWLFAA